MSSSSRQSSPQSDPDRQEAPSKVLNLRRMIRRERQNRVLVWAIGCSGFLLIMATELLALHFEFGKSEDDEGFFDSMYFGIQVLGHGFLCVCAIPFMFYLARYRPAKTRKLIKLNLACYGNLEELIDQIDGQLSDSRRVLDFDWVPDRFFRLSRGTIILTKSWLLWFGWSEFRFLPIGEVLWFYKRLVTNSRIWSTQDRFAAQLVCVTNNGDRCMLRMLAEDWVDEALEALTRRRPEALFGFQVEWQQLVEHDMAALHKEVAHRRHEWEQLSRRQRADWTDDRIDDSILSVRRVDASLTDSEKKY